MFIDLNWVSRVSDMAHGPLVLILQGLGEVVRASKNSPLPVGQAVMYFTHGAFSDYKVMPVFSFRYSCYFDQLL